MWKFSMLDSENALHSSNKYIFCVLKSKLQNLKWQIQDFKCTYTCLHLGINS